MVVSIIGAGASGLMLAVQLNNMDLPNLEVHLFERMDRVGKKILVTGNGHCNFTNEYLDINKYNHPWFADRIVEVFDTDRIIFEFQRLGLFVHRDPSGRYYPVSDMASTILDLLRNNIGNTQVHLNTEIKNITKPKDKFILESNNGTFESDFVVIATGGMSQSVHGSNGSGYKLAKAFGHHITDLAPGLSIIYVEEDLRSLTNLRIKARVRVYDGSEPVFDRGGEILFKDNYLSGIVIFEASRIINRDRNKKYRLELDLISVDYNDVIKELFVYPGKTCLDAMSGFFPKMVNRYLLVYTGIDPSINKPTPKQIGQLVYNIHHLAFTPVHKNQFENSQVTLGGVSLDEVTYWLESRKVDDLYFTGEVLDIDGDCGGYNLHMAFATACQVADAIRKKVTLIDRRY